MRNLTLAFLFILISAFSYAAQAQSASMAGSRTSMQNQHQHAVHHGYTFIRTASHVGSLTETGELVKVAANQHIELHAVSFPYLRVSVKTLLERLGSQYHNACGEKMTVTSMTRPIERQPANAHSDSVHPTGMAFDLRIPSKASCRSWLERTLLELERKDVLDVTRERRPPHYHVAVFPEPYEHYLASLTGQDREYVVRRGDTLTSIAASMDTSIPQLRDANGLRGDLINIGQKLMLPADRAVSVAATDSGTMPASTASIQRPAGATVMNVSYNPGANARELTARELTHQVKRGETLWRIASRYRTSVDALKDENGLADDLLRIGQVLRIVIEES